MDQSELTTRGLETAREAALSELPLPLNQHAARHLLTSEGLACGIEIGKRVLRVTTNPAKVTCFYCHFAAAARRDAAEVSRGG